jgi:hypothetical protein
MTEAAPATARLKAVTAASSSMLRFSSRILMREKRLIMEVGSGGLGQAGCYDRLAASSSAGSGSSRRKGAGINGLFFSGSAVQFDKVDQHHPVRRLTVVFGLGKNGTLVGQRDPRS